MSEPFLSYHDELIRFISLFRQNNVQLMIKIERLQADVDKNRAISVTLSPGGFDWWREGWNFIKFVETNWKEFSLLHRLSNLPDRSPQCVEKINLFPFSIQDKAVTQNVALKVSALEANEVIHQIGLMYLRLKESRQ